MNQEAYRFGKLVALVNKLHPLNAHQVAEAAKAPALWFGKNAGRVCQTMAPLGAGATAETRDPQVNEILDQYRKLVGEMSSVPKRFDIDGSASFWLGWQHGS
mgnify:CR=1 FL=1